jgi:hypothetical protein
MYKNLTYDAAAVEVVNADTNGKGAVMFKGWLGPTAALPNAPGANAPDPKVQAGHVRFFTHPQFLDWLEIDAEDILYQTNAAADDPEGGSVIWIKREARIRRCQDGEACWFEHAMGETADDPTAHQGWRSAAETVHRKGSYP